MNLVCFLYPRHLKVYNRIREPDFGLKLCKAYYCTQRYCYSITITYK